MFPNTATGRIRLPGLDAEHADMVLDRIKESLASVGATEIQCSADTIDFKGKGYAILPETVGSITTGVIRVGGQPLTVEYRFTMTVLLIFSTTMALGLLLLMTTTTSGFNVLFWLCPAFWLLWVGGDSLYTWLRLRWLIRRAARSLGEDPHRCPRCGVIYDAAEPCLGVRFCRSCQAMLSGPPEDPQQAYLDTA